MAFATKYKTTIQNWDGDTITAEIQEDGFAGSLEEFTPIGSSPIQIEHQTNINKKHSYIIPSTATVKIFVNNEWDLLELLYSNDRQFKLIIKNGDDELFIGWVLAGINTQSYTTGQYKVTIRATDGLNDLKNIPYVLRGYGVEWLYTSGGFAVYALNTSFGDIQTRFSVGDKINVSDIRNVSDDALVIRGGIFTISSIDISAGRTRLFTSDSVFSSSDREVHGVLNTMIKRNDYQTPLRIIQNCLSNTGLYLDFWENTDIYAADGMTTTTNTHSPLNQSFINTKAYGINLDDAISTWDVLEKICQAFHCRIYQFKNIGTADPAKWYMSKINKIGETTTYRLYFNTGVYDTFLSYDPLLAMGTDVNHVGGTAQISVKQAYKEIQLKTDRGINYNILEGSNFEDKDFLSSSSLGHWGALSNAQLISSWSTATITKTTINNNITAELAYNNDASAPSPLPATNNGGTVRLTWVAHSLTTSDWLLISDGIYRGIWKIWNVSGLNTDIRATYIEDVAETPVQQITNLDGIETSAILPLGNDIGLVDSENQTVKVEGSFYFATDVSINERAVICILMARVNATDYKVLNTDGLWVDYDAEEIHPIIIPITDKSNNLQSFEVEGAISDSNFYTTTTHDMYVAIMSVNGSSSRDNIKWNSLKISVTGGENETITEAIDSNVVDILKDSFGHPDGDGGDNDEYRFISPISDDATPRRFINSWKQDGGTAENLEDILLTNLANSYGNNSQIWRGNLNGSMSILNAVTDPLNFNREFQIQKIKTDLSTNYNNVSMIEIIPYGFGGGISKWYEISSVTLKWDFNIGRQIMFANEGQSGSNKYAPIGIIAADVFPSIGSLIVGTYELTFNVDLLIGSNASVAIIMNFGTSPSSPSSPSNFNTVTKTADYSGEVVIRGYTGVSVGTDDSVGIRITYNSSDTGTEVSITDIPTITYLGSGDLV